MQAKLEKIYRVELPALDPVEGTAREILNALPKLRSDLGMLLESICNIESALRSEQGFVSDPAARAWVQEQLLTLRHRDGANIKILAIKAAREHFYIGLKEAKDLVESVMLSIGL